MIAVLLALAACDPYRAWPEPGTAFPDVYTPEDDLEPWEEVRWETETWDPLTDTQSAALYLLKAANHRQGAPPESLLHFDAMRGLVPPLVEGDLRLSFVGDAMWIPDNHASFAVDVEPLLDGDLRIGNLETPTSPDHPTGLGELGLYAFNSPPALLDGLPLDVVQVNNNHSLDAGEEGLTATLAEIAARGLVATGVDTHATVEVDGRTIAFLSYTWGINQRDVVPERDLFVVPFGHVGEDIDLSSLAADVAAARAEADHVVVLVHWGFEYEYYPDPHFLVLGRRLVEAGADLVVGQGPHVVQPPEVCQVNLPEIVPGIGACSLRTDDGEPRTAAILYSLGDFESIVATTPCRVGIVASVSLDEGGVSGLGWSAVANVTAGPHRLVPLDAALDDEDFAAESARLDAHLGADWRRSGAP